MLAALTDRRFDANHLLARMLQSGEQRVWLDDLRATLDPANAGDYLIAIPVSVRHELVSFTPYGAHSNGRSSIRKSSCSKISRASATRSLLRSRGRRNSGSFCDALTVDR